MQYFISRISKRISEIIRARRNKKHLFINSQTRHRPDCLQEGERSILRIPLRRANAVEAFGSNCLNPFISNVMGPLIQLFGLDGIFNAPRFDPTPG